MAEFETRAFHTQHEREEMIAVWFSCGAASAAALKLTVDKYGKNEVRAVNTPIVEEHPDNQRFLKDVEDWVGVEIETATHNGFTSADQIWRNERAMAFPLGAPCTRLLKKQARYDWEAIHNPDWHVLGFTSEEQNRHDRFVQFERDNVLPVLIDAKMSKHACGDLIREAGLRLPEMYRLGYPNANCIGCVKAGSPTYWNKIRVDFPEVFNARAELSRELGAKLVVVHGERVFLDELDPLAEGRPMWTMPPCGLFCSE